MSTAWQEFDSRIVDWLSVSPSRIPLVTGGCHSGRTEMLGRVVARLGSATCQTIDVSRITTTPERFARAVADGSPFGNGRPPLAGDGPAGAFRWALAFLGTAGAEHAPATFLLDEVLDLATFESFPGLKTVVTDTFGALLASRNHFVLTTRFTSRALRAARALPERLLVHPIPALETGDVVQALAGAPGVHGSSADDLARTIVALTDGRRGYAQDIVSDLAAGGEPAPDPVSVMARLLAPGGSLAHRCAYSYEMRLNRTRGYGTLRAILGILADEEPLTLTEIAHLMQRTPGSTKDYLSWLEEVDLVVMRHKRYAYTDPVLRVWVRLNGGSVGPTEERVVAEVRRYALGCLS